MVYLDNAATTAPLKSAFSEACAFAGENYYNPSALYGGGVCVRQEVERARAFFEGLFEGFGVIFTSGGTEADNQAIFSSARRGNVVTTMGEHPAVDNAVKQLKALGVEPRFAPIGRDGRVDGQALLSLVDERTSLVSVVHVNSETGAVNDICALAREVKKKNPRCKFHSDGVQAFGKLSGRLSGDIDLYSVSAHKIGGIKGCGALFYKKGTPPAPYLFGGGQEGNLRSGTENVLGILSFFYAAEERLPQIGRNAARMKELCELLFASLEEGTFLRISPVDGSPYILTVSARGMRGEVLLRLIDSRGVIVGTGSACSSKRPHSRILEACGYEADILGGVLRMSLCPETGEEDVLFAAKAINESVKEWRERVS